jgi:hypothetical protein
VQTVIILSFLFSFPFTGTASVSPAQSGTWTAFFLEDLMWVPYRDEATGIEGVKEGPSSQWCAYTSMALFESEAKRLRPLTVGEVTYRNAVISAIHIEESDESGDWGLSDDYDLDERGTVRTVKRALHVIPGDIDRDEVWIVKNGKAILQKRVIREGGKVTAHPDNWAPDVPVRTTLSAFPFASLVRRREAIAGNGTACEIAIPEVVARKAPKPLPPVKSWKTWVDRFGWSIEYPSTWKPESTCGIRCAVGFSVPNTDFTSGGFISVNGLEDKPAKVSAGDWLTELKHTQNRNRMVSEMSVTVDNRPALTARYSQNTDYQMEHTFVVNGTAVFEISINGPGQIEELPDYVIYRHMLASFKFLK